MQTAKQEALDTIKNLPDNVDYEEILYRLYVLNKVHQGLEDVESDKIIASEELEREMEQW